MDDDSHNTKNARLSWLLFGLSFLIAGIFCYHGIYQAKPREDIKEDVAPVAMQKVAADEPKLVQTYEDIPRGVDGVQELDTDIFVAYGSVDHDMQRDLEILQEGILSYAMLVKNDDLPTGSNAMCIDALCGNNKSRIRFLRKDHPMLNAEGELIDRWGTPVYFHAVSSQDIGLRSAGPDKQMWTEDDFVLGSASQAMLEKEVNRD